MTIDFEQARRLALCLPEATEEPHHGFPSYRVAGKIFATLPDDDHLHIMLGEEEIETAAQSHPGFCEEKWWGKKLSALRIDLSNADGDLVRGFLERAWLRRAPKRLHATKPSW